MKKKILLIIALFLFPVFVFAENEYTIDKLETNITINEKEITYKDKINTTLIDEKVTLNKKANKIYNKENKTAISLDLTGNKEKQNNSIEYSLPLEKKHNDIALSNDYNAPINELEFTVKLDVDYDKIHFLLNGKDITDAQELTYTIENGVIKGKYSKKLNENDNLVITLKDNEKKEKILSYIDIIIPFITLIISYIIWLRYGKDLKNPDIRNIELPNKNILETSFMYNSYNKKEDYIYMLLYLANKGAIKIKEVDGKYIISKIKNYETYNKQEIAILDKIFTDTKSISLSEYIDNLTNNSKKVELKELDIKEYVNKINYLEKTNEKITNELNLEEKYFEKVNIQRNIIIFLMALTLIAVTTIPFITLNKIHYMLIPTIFSIIILYTIINTLGKNKIDLSAARRAGILFSTIFIAWLIIITSMSTYEHLHVVAFAIGIISIIIMTILYRYMPKRTKYGTKELAKLEKIKKFAKTVDTMDIEEGIKKNKNYVYDLLPYLYLTGESDSLIKKATKLNVKQPKWLETKEDISIEEFDKLVNKFIKMINSK